MSSIAPPPRGLLLLEGRALLELAALLPAYPFLRRAPAGDGHPVLVLPGFMASDFSTRTLRRFLRERGYGAHGWKLGPQHRAVRPRRVGPGRKARRAAPPLRQAREPDRLEPRRHLRPRAGAALPHRGAAGDHPGEPVPRPRGEQRAALSRRPPADPSERGGVARATLRAPLAVPTTSIWSRSDGIAAWRSCVVEAGPLSENIEVESEPSRHRPPSRRAAHDRRPTRAGRGGVEAVPAAGGMALAAGTEGRVSDERVVKRRCTQR